MKTCVYEANSGRPVPKSFSISHSTRSDPGQFRNSLCVWLRVFLAYFPIRRNGPAQFFGPFGRSTTARPLSPTLRRNFPLILLIFWFRFVLLRFFSSSFVGFGFVAGWLVGVARPTSVTPPPPCLRAAARLNALATEVRRDRASVDLLRTY